MSKKEPAEEPMEMPDVLDPQTDVNAVAKELITYHSEYIRCHYGWVQSHATLQITTGNLKESKEREEGLRKEVTEMKQKYEELHRKHEDEKTHGVRALVVQPNVKVENAQGAGGGGAGPRLTTASTKKKFEDGEIVHLLSWLPATDKFPNHEAVKVAKDLEEEKGKFWEVLDTRAGHYFKCQGCRDFACILEWIDKQNKKYKKMPPLSFPMAGYQAGMYMQRHCVFGLQMCPYALEEKKHPFATVTEANEATIQRALGGEKNNTKGSDVSVIRARMNDLDWKVRTKEGAMEAHRAFLFGKLGVTVSNPRNCMLTLRKVGPANLLEVKYPTFMFESDAQKKVDKEAGRGKDYEELWKTSSYQVKCSNPTDTKAECGKRLSTLYPYNLSGTERIDVDLFEMCWYLANGIPQASASTLNINNSKPRKRALLSNVLRAFQAREEDLYGVHARKHPKWDHIQVDETFLCKRKYHQGKQQRIETWWFVTVTHVEVELIQDILHMTTLATHWEITKVRDNDTLLNIIRPFLREDGQTVVYTDSWAGYNGLDVWCKHRKCNHSKSFIGDGEDGNSSVHINNAESVHAKVKQMLKKLWSHATTDKWLIAQFGFLTQVFVGPELGGRKNVLNRMRLICQTLRDYRHVLVNDADEMLMMVPPLLFNTPAGDANATLSGDEDEVPQPAQEEKKEPKKKAKKGGGRGAGAKPESGVSLMYDAMMKAYDQRKNFGMMDWSKEDFDEMAARASADDSLNPNLSDDGIVMGVVHPTVRGATNADGDVNGKVVALDCVTDDESECDDGEDNEPEDMGFKEPGDAEADGDAVPTAPREEGERYGGLLQDQYLKSPLHPRVPPSPSKHQRRSRARHGTDSDTSDTSSGDESTDSSDDEDDHLDEETELFGQNSEERSGAQGRDLRTTNFNPFANKTLRPSSRPTQMSGRYARDPHNYAEGDYDLLKPLRAQEDDDHILMNFLYELMTAGHAIKDLGHDVNIWFSFRNDGSPSWEVPTKREECDPLRRRSKPLFIVVECVDHRNKKYFTLLLVKHDSCLDGFDKKHCFTGKGKKGVPFRVQRVCGLKSKQAPIKDKQKKSILGKLNDIWRDAEKHPKPVQMDDIAWDRVSVSSISECPDGDGSWATVPLNTLKFHGGADAVKARFPIHTTAHKVQPCRPCILQWCTIKNLSLPPVQTKHRPAAATIHDMANVSGFGKKRAASARALSGSNAGTDMEFNNQAGDATPRTPGVQLQDADDTSRWNWNEVPGARIEGWNSCPHCVTGNFNERESSEEDSESDSGEDSDGDDGHTNTVKRKPKTKKEKEKEKMETKNKKKGAKKETKNSKKKSQKK